MNPRQTLFAKEYAVDHNATQAAIRAGYSKKTAYSQGQRLLNHAEVSVLVKAQQDKQSEALELTTESVLTGLNEIATDKKLAPSARVRAYELLGKHQGLFTERVEVTQIPSAALVEEWVEALEADVAGNG